MEFLKMFRCQTTVNHTDPPSLLCMFSRSCCVNISSSRFNWDVDEGSHKEMIRKDPNTYVHELGFFSGSTNASTSMHKCWGVFVCSQVHTPKQIWYKSIHKSSQGVGHQRQKGGGRFAHPQLDPKWPPLVRISSGSSGFSGSH